MLFIIIFKFVVIVLTKHRQKRILKRPYLNYVNLCNVIDAITGNESEWIENIGNLQWYGWGDLNKGVLKAL